MVERFRGWIDDVEYKIKDAIKKKNGVVSEIPGSSFYQQDDLSESLNGSDHIAKGKPSLIDNSRLLLNQSSIPSTDTDILGGTPKTNSSHQIPDKSITAPPAAESPSSAQSLPSSVLSDVPSLTDITPDTTQEVPHSQLVPSNNADMLDTEQTAELSCNSVKQIPDCVSGAVFVDNSKLSLSGSGLFSETLLPFSQNSCLSTELTSTPSSSKSKDLLEKSNYIGKILQEQKVSNESISRYCDMMCGDNQEKHSSKGTELNHGSTFPNDDCIHMSEAGYMESSMKIQDYVINQSDVILEGRRVTNSSACSTTPTTTTSERDILNQPVSLNHRANQSVRNRKHRNIISESANSELADSSSEGEEDTELMDPLLLPLGTDHELLDHAFTADTPEPSTTHNFNRLLGRARRYTSDVLENYDVENDPSQTVDELNEKAKFGRPVIPEIECDIAIRISSRVDLELLAWFKKELSHGGLIVKSYTGYSKDHFLKVTATRARFLKGAESMELLKRVHPDRGDGLKHFIRHKSTIFCPRQSTDGFLSAAERQLILYDYINSLRTEVTVDIGGTRLHKHDAIVSRLITHKIIKQIYPLHQKSKQKVLNREWVWNIFGRQPLGLVRHYFGDEIALYFAWLGFYTFILIIPLIVGLTIKRYYDDEVDGNADWCFTFYAFFNVIWPSLFLELWKRRSAELAWEWGTLGRDIEARDNQRPQFYGRPGVNPITGKIEIQYSDIRRQLKQVVSMLVSGVCLLGVLCSMLAVFRFGDYIKEITKENRFPTFIPTFLTKFIKYLPKILLPITVGILDEIYKKIAISLNNWENYRNQRTYENWLMLKLIFFKFVNSFLALFYIAFYLQDFDELRTALATLLITKQIIGNCGEILGPIFKGWIKVYLLQKNASPPSPDEENKKLPQVELESEKPLYFSCFDDFLEMFIQMGYVILFSAAYPLAAVWAFLNNLVEIRGDAFKLVNGVQRPFIKRVEDIGFWQDAFEVLSVISIVVNCSLIGIRGQVGRWFPTFTAGQQILFIIVMEHVFLSIRYAITRGIPDVPDWVVLASSKERYNREQVLKRLEKMVRRSRVRISKVEEIMNIDSQSHTSDCNESSPDEMTSFSNELRGYKQE